MKPTLNPKPQLNLIILGDPGAGKATQAKLLAKKFSFIDFDMGKELVKQRKSNDRINQIHKTTTDLGKLTPTTIVRELLTDKISSTPINKGIVFDGTPKMLGEAKLVVKLLKKLGRPNPVVIYLSIPQAEISQRVLKRKGYYANKFGKRADDNVVALKNRARYYRKNIAEVVDFFSQVYPFQKINAQGSIPEVHKKVLQTLTKLQQQNEKLHKN